MRCEARVSSKGQVTVPREIRRALRVKQGDILVFETDETGVHLRARKPTSAFAAYAGIWRVGGGLTVEEINAQLREMRGHDE